MILTIDPNWGTALMSVESALCCVLNRDKLAAGGVHTCHGSVKPLPRWFRYRSKNQTKTTVGGGNSNIFVIFTTTWGRWTHFDEHIFQMGWNHQLEKIWAVMKNLLVQLTYPGSQRALLSGWVSYLFPFGGIWFLVPWRVWRITRFPWWHVGFFGVGWTGMLRGRWVSRYWCLEGPVWGFRIWSPTPHHMWLSWDE